MPSRAVWGGMGSWGWFCTAFGQRHSWIQGERSPGRYGLQAQTGSTTTPLQCLLLSLHFSFMESAWGNNPKSCGASQGMCFLRGEAGWVALQNAVFVL